jgi:hypothetical protein
MRPIGVPPIQASAAVGTLLWGPLVIAIVYAITVFRWV